MQKSWWSLFFLRKIFIRPILLEIALKVKFSDLFKIFLKFLLQIIWKSWEWLSKFQFKLCLGKSLFSSYNPKGSRPVKLQGALSSYRAAISIDWYSRKGKIVNVSKHGQTHLDMLKLAFNSRRVLKIECWIRMKILKRMKDWSISNVGEWIELISLFPWHFYPAQMATISLEETIAGLFLV